MTRHRLISISIFAGLLCLMVGTQIKYDQTRLKHLKNDLKITYNESIEPHVPNPDILPYISFGQNTIVADTLWLTSIQYYGAGDPYGKYRELARLMKSITILDSRFSYPYEFSATVLPYEGFTDEAIAILQHGEVALPKMWEIPYNIGSVYYINKKDSVTAAIYYTKASAIPGAPPTADFLAAAQYERVDDDESAFQLYSKLAESSTNTYIKDRAEEHVVHYFLLKKLNEATLTFRARERRFPTSLQELADKHYIPEVPTDPLGRPILYDAGTGLVTSPIIKKQLS